MIDLTKAFNILRNYGVSFFTGVPDSYLNGFCDYAHNNCGKDYIIAANEGNAIGIAAGHYFATGEVPLVFMQNSGLGNALNPLVSLAYRDIYSVPMILLIGWRGQSGMEPNHPQHWLQGEITTTLLDVMHIPYSILEEDDDKFEKIIKKACNYCNEKRQPFGLISPKAVFSSNEKDSLSESVYSMSREEALEAVLDSMPANTIFSATTGRTTRELFFLRKKRNESIENDFMNVGSMGHASSVALGMAMKKNDREVVILDGDGAAIMHMGALAVIANSGVSNLMHIVLNNGVHDSVGGQPSVGFDVNLTEIAEGCGYRTVGKAITTRYELFSAIKTLRSSGKASFIDCRIHKGLSRKLPPLRFSHKNAIDSLMNNLQQDKGGSHR